MVEAAQRLRQHPEQRFGPPLLQFEIETVAAKLLAEALPPNRRHRQETLYHHGPLTIALFLFEQGASLPQHSAEGVVTVQVLQGRIKMTAQGAEHELTSGSILVLARGLKHDLQAVEASRVLLTVCLDRQNPSKEAAATPASDGGDAKSTIDVRAIPGPQRHPVIFNTFDSLQVGEALEIVNNHDPVPLHNQFNSMKPEQFHWEYLERGPEIWRVRISRIQPHNRA